MIRYIICVIFLLLFLLIFNTFIIIIIIINKLIIKYKKEKIYKKNIKTEQRYTRTGILYNKFYLMLKNCYIG